MKHTNKCVPQYDLLLKSNNISIQTSASFESSCGERFNAKGRRQIDPGFTAIYERKPR